MSPYRWSGIALAGLALSGCMSLDSVPPLPAQWTREQFPRGDERCNSFRCPVTISRGIADLTVRTTTKRLAPHEIPGWEKSKGARFLSWIGGEVIRGIGGQTDHLVIGTGTRTVSENRPDGWRLRCTVFWIDENTTERQGGSDQEVESRRLTEGMQCRAFTPMDTSSIRWRLRSGIAPPLDSIAATYDSLAAAKSPLIGGSPPTVIEHLSGDGVVVDQLQADIDTSKRGLQSLATLTYNFTRKDGSLAAQMHLNLKTTFDYAPGTTEEDKRIFRLFGAALAVRLH